MKILDTPRSGKCGQVVAFQSRYGLCLRTYLIPHNTMTPAREHMRAVFGNSSRLWSGKLTEDQRNRWCAAGPKVMSHPRLGQRGPLTGQQLWQSINSVRGCVGLALTLEPPEPVTFGPSPVGQLTITNDENGVRLWVAVTGDLNEDIMVFAQAPCPAGRYKRRNVAYLGLLQPPIGGLSEITHLYTAKYGEPRPGRKVFVVTSQQKDGWKAIERETSAIVPLPPRTPAARRRSNRSQIHPPSPRRRPGVFPLSPSHQLAIIPICTREVQGLHKGLVGHQVALPRRAASQRNGINERRGRVRKAAAARTRRLAARVKRAGLL